MIDTEVHGTTVRNLDSIYRVKSKWVDLFSDEFENKKIFVEKYFNQFLYQPIFVYLFLILICVDIAEPMIRTQL